MPRHKWNCFVAGSLALLKAAEAMMNTTTEYRRYAEECQRLAEQTQDVPSKNGYLALARYWLQLSKKSKVQTHQQLVEPHRSSLRASR